MKYSLVEALNRIYGIETWKPIGFEDFNKQRLMWRENRPEYPRLFLADIGKKIELTESMKQKIANQIVNEFAINCWLSWNVKYVHWLGICLSKSKRRVDGVNFQSDYVHDFECLYKSDLALFFKDGNIECYEIIHNS